MAWEHCTVCVNRPFETCAIVAARRAGAPALAAAEEAWGQVHLATLRLPWGSPERAAAEAAEAPLWDTYHALEVAHPACPPSAEGFGYSDEDERRDDD